MKIDKDIIDELRKKGLLKASTYILYNEETGDYYIGSSSQTEKRLRDHVRSLSKNTHANIRFQRSYNKNSNFEFAVQPTDTPQAALAYEAALIAVNWGDPNLLNLAKDVVSPRLGMVASDETKAKQSQYWLKYYADGGVSPSLGSVRSDETKEKLRAAALACSDETKEKLRAAAIAQFANPEARESASRRTTELFKDDGYRTNHREAISSALHTAEVKEKMVTAAKQRWSSAEEREKQSKLTTDRLAGPEARKKLSVAQSKCWQDPAFRAKLCHRVSINGVLHESLSEAARAHGVCIATVCNRIANNNPMWSSWIYAS